MKSVEILIADDHESFRSGLRSLIESRREWRVCGEAVDGMDAVEKAAALAPRLILMDVSMPRMNGLDATKEIRRQMPECPILIVSQNDPEVMRKVAVQAGANGFIHKSQVALELLNAIDGLIANGAGHTRADSFRNGAEAPNAAPPSVSGDEDASRELQFRALAESIPQLVWAAERDGHIFWYNRRWYEYTGKTHAEMEGWGWQSVHDPEILPRVMTQWKHSLETGEPFEMVYPLRGADGAFREFLTRVHPVKDPHGSIVRWFGTNTDITDQRRAQDEMRTSEERFRAIVETTPECVKLVSPEGILLLMNTSGLRMVGVSSADEVVGKNVYGLIAPEDRERFKAFNESICRGERGTLEFEIIGVDGRRRHMETHAAPLRNPDGSVINLGVTRDVSERKVAQEALMQSRLRLSAEADALASLNEKSWGLWRSSTLEEGLEEMLTAVIEMVGADRGNIQLFDLRRAALTIVAHRGFQRDFLDFFREVKAGDNAGCALALRTGERVLIDDVENEPQFAPVLSVFRAAGVRAIISTPLIGPDQTPLGVVSAHFSSPRRFADQDLRRLDLYARQASDFIQRNRTVDTLRQSEDRLRRLSVTLDAEVRARTAELEEQNTHVVKQAEHVRDLSWRLLRAQDDERRHIARELHDSAGQTLAVLGIHLDQLVQKAGRLSPELATDAESIQETVEQLHQEIRTASYLLHPPLLDENGLYFAVNWYVRGLSERSGLEIRLEIDDEFGRLPRDMELAVFRLVQECLTNVHRHSGSRTAFIRIVREEVRILVEVRDQGRGMSSAKMAEIHLQGSGVGIRGIRERLRPFKGEMRIESDQSGTRVLVTIPLTENDR